MSEIIKLDNISKIFKIPHMHTNNLKTFLLHLRKMRTYEEFYALKGINLTIKKGEFVGIIGKNGSGKSTLLKIIAGILNPTTGKVTVKGAISPFLELGVGFNLELSAKENIFLYSSILGLTKKEAINRYPEILDFSELKRFIDAPLKNFSSGMQVRLAFSVTVQSKAPILLVDEVLAVGDAAFQEKCFSVFNDFKAKGKTIVFVSHDMQTISTFCDRVVYLKSGSEIITGQADEIIDLYLSDMGVMKNS